MISENDKFKRNKFLYQKVFYICGVKIMLFENLKSKNQYTDKQIFLINVLIRLGILAFVVLILPFLLFKTKKASDAVNTTEVTTDTPAIVDEGSVIAEVKDKISAREFSEAQSLLEDLKKFNANNESIYLYEADIYLNQNNYLSAISSLEKGIDITSSSMLTNRKNYICNNVVCVKAISEDGENTISHVYDYSGNLIYDEKYNAAYEITGWNEYTYDSSGLLSICSTFNSEGDLEKRGEYSYDASNTLTLVEDYNSKNAIQGWHEYSYDSSGREIEVVDYGKNKKVSWITTTEYDSDGRLFRNAGYDSKNRLTGWVDTLYDNNGHVTKMARYDTKGQVVEWNETFYNDKGNPIDFASYYQDSELTNTTKFLYDTKDRKTEEIYFNAEGIEIGYAQFNIADKKTEERNIETGIKWHYEYKYLGDILCDVNPGPLSGTLTFNGSAQYKRIPSKEAAYIGKANKNTKYNVIGETTDFYQVDKGWYFYKDDLNVVYNP